MSRTPLLLGTLAVAFLALDGTTFAGRPDPASARVLAARIDDALVAAWKAEGLEPAPLASDLELYRRLSLDLLGTIPSLEEIRRFEAMPANGRRERIVEQLFQDPRFHDELAERLARSVVGAGKKQDDLFYRRRRFVDWLRQQLVLRRPWDEVVRELVSAEGITIDGPANFIAAADADPIKLASRTTRAFLGVRMDCAQCHDHPFADWKQKDFEGIAAYFGRVRRQGPIVREMGDLVHFEVEDAKAMGAKRIVQPRVPFASEAIPSSGKKASSPRQQLASWITDPRNPYFARALANRLWAWLLGRGLIEHVDEIDEGKPSVPAALALLEEDLCANRFDIERLVLAIVSTKAYALSSRGAASEKVEAMFAIYPLKPLYPDQLARSVWQATSVWTEDDDRSLLFRLARLDQTNKFMQRHGGDLDAETPEDPTLLRRLLLMNGGLVHERIKADGPFSATGRLVLLTTTNEALVEAAYLMVLGRRPSPKELEHFVGRLSHRTRSEKTQAAEDLMWALLNSTEFSWNH